MVFSVEVPYDLSFSDENKDGWNSDLNRRVRRDVEQRNILIDDAKIEELRKEMKEAKFKMEKALELYQSYITNYMGKRDYLNYRIRSHENPVSETECRMLLRNCPPIGIPLVVTITKVSIRDDDICCVDDAISLL